MKKWFLSIALALLSVGVMAQDKYPERPIRFLVGYAPGGTTDVVARILAKEMETRLGQPVIVDNKPGASGNLAGLALARSAPDGYTIGVCGLSNATTPWLYKSLGYDALKDYAPISRLISAPSVLLVSPSMRPKTVAELTALIKQSPGKYAYASTGVGGSPHLATEMLSQRAGLKMLHVPYKGASPALMDLIAGRVQLGFQTEAAALPFVRSGKLRALAVTSNTRSEQLPDVPTMAEAGIPNLEILSWNALCAPAGTSPGVVARLNQVVMQAMAAPEVLEKLRGLGMHAEAGTPDALHKYLQSETERWKKVIQTAGIRIDE